MSDNPWNVSEFALRIIEQRAICWPGDLFCQVLIDEVSSSRALLSRPPLGTRATVELAATHQWVMERLGPLFHSRSFEGHSFAQQLCQGLQHVAGSVHTGLHTRWLTDLKLLAPRHGPIRRSQQIRHQIHNRGIVGLERGAVRLFWRASQWVFVNDQSIKAGGTPCSGFSARSVSVAVTWGTSTRTT